MNIRTAHIDEADSVAALLRDSIRTLCGPDHGNDPAIVDAWTANKTRDEVARWIEAPGTIILVARSDDGIVGVGGYSPNGTILLNYVAPAHRFQGISKELLRHMEAALRGLGVETGRLTSSETARSFYLSAGWTADGPPERHGGRTGHPMHKRL